MYLHEYNNGTCNQLIDYKAYETNNLPLIQDKKHALPHS